MLDFELKLDIQEDNICGIPIVENLKILGHFFGKNKAICDYQNFYSKIAKLEKIERIWNQRTTTIIRAANYPQNSPDYNLRRNSSYIPVQLQTLADNEVFPLIDELIRPINGMMS